MPKPEKLSTNATSGLQESYRRSNRRDLPLKAAPVDRVAHQANRYASRMTAVHKGKPKLQRLIDSEDEKSSAEDDEEIDHVSKKKPKVFNLDCGKLIAANDDDEEDDKEEDATSEEDGKESESEEEEQEEESEGETDNNELDDQDAKTAVEGPKLTSKERRKQQYLEKVQQRRQQKQDNLTAFQRAKLEYHRMQGEKQEARKRKIDQQNKAEAEKVEMLNWRKRKDRAVKQRTKKGQPNFNAVMDCIVQKLEKERSRQA